MRMPGATFGEGFKSLINLSQLQLLPCDIRELKNDTFINFRYLPIKTMFLRCNLKSIESGTLEQFRTLQSLTGNESFVRLLNFKSSFFNLTIPENASTSMQAT
jgi:hypothetical protein